MGMRIIAGAARNIELATPSTMAVRPTAGRSRKALFDSLGGALPGAVVLDLCAGSGALGLEAASRGAAEVTLVETNSRHIAVIEENIRKVQRAGVKTLFTIVHSTAESLHAYLERCPDADFIFADPPYAESAGIFTALLGLKQFRSSYAGSKLIWELPDTPGAIGPFLNTGFLEAETVRRFGGTDFLIGAVRP